MLVRAVRFNGCMLRSPAVARAPAPVFFVLTCVLVAALSACGNDTVTTTVYVQGDASGPRLGDGGSLFGDASGASSGGADAADTFVADAALDGEATDAAGTTDTGGAIDAGITDAGATDTTAADVGATGGCAAGCDDGLACTKDVCKDGFCVVEPLADFCIVAGKCWSSGPVAGQQCKVCAPEISVFSLLDATDTPCDDANTCTVKDTCTAGQCQGKPGPGCCQSNEDCSAATGCQVGVCDVATGGCSYQQKPGCCAFGLCCDVGKLEPMPAGTPCGQVPSKTEWGCSGAVIRQRTAVPGCDGQDASACSDKAEFATWGAWQTVQTCPTGQVCSPAVDPNKQPECSASGGGCSTDAMCNDGQGCTVDSCVGGSCKHTPTGTGLLCGIDKTVAEYRCSPSNTASVEIRYAARLCGAGAACPAADGSNFANWTAFSSCGNGVCTDDGDPKTPPKCGQGAQCKAGTTCCATDGSWAKQATKCGTTAAKTEYKCDGTAGGTIMKRAGFAGCGGSSSFCTASLAQYVAWEPWEVDKKCPADHKCDVGYAGQSATCTDTKQCKADTECCDAKGFFAAQGSKCGATVYDSEYKCEAVGTKGAAFMMRDSYKGCTGQSTWCSSGTANLHWGDWQKIAGCKATEACKEPYYSGLKPTCVNATQCKAGTTCCTADDLYAAKATACGSTELDSETRCTATGEAVQQRTAFAGCSGSSTTCYQYTSSYYAWTPWKTAFVCGTGAKCKAQSSTKAVCEGGSTECSPSAKCCTPAGKWAPAMTQCGSYAYGTEYKCTTASKGGKVLRRKGYGGCTGTNSLCSSDKALLAWTAWEDYLACEKYEICQVTEYSASCKNVSKCSPSSPCCTEAGEYAAAGLQCGTYPIATAYKCSGADKGADVLAQDTYRGCSGKSGTCSYSDSDNFVAAWKVAQDCPATQYCYVTQWAHTCTTAKP